MATVRSTHVRAAFLCLGAVLASSCAAAPMDGPSLELTLASPDKASDTNGTHVKHFAAEVYRLSEGTIRITPQWDVEPDGAHDWDQDVGRRVADGEFDLGLVPGRAWDELGVTTLRALDTPFLVPDLTRLKAVLNSDVRTDLLSGLPTAGVVGVDLFPDELRHPFGYRRPMLNAEDYRNTVVRAPTSATTRMFLEAMGATVVDDPADPRVQRGVESSYGPSLAGVATGNVSFFPKTETLVIDGDVRDRLRDDQWEVLQQAAVETREWLFDNLPTDAESAAAYCERGGRIVAADHEDIASFRPAAEQVRQELEQDADTRQIIQAIDELAETIDAETEPVTRCPRTDPPDPSGHDVLDGLYTTRVTARALRRAGVTDPNHVRENAARYVWTLEGGTWHYEATAHHYIQTPIESGQYTYRNGLFTFHWNDGGSVEARLDIDRDGTIRFVSPRDSDPALQAETDAFFGSPWRRVSDVPD